ncbi:RNA-directed DNA polymerase, eukaryota [Tanacetum coccineum]
MAAKFRSNADFTQSISKSIFVTNFPDDTTSKDLWSVCQTYGTLVDVYIPNHKSKAGKRFAFVRFIRVDNVDRLVGNLCTLWIGRMHLHANVVRFEHTPNSPPRTVRPTQTDSPGVGSVASALQGNARIPPYISPMPAVVLDDSCVVERDLQSFVMGELKLFSSISNLRSLLLKEGFPNVNLTYLGGLWVMMELESINSKEKFIKHVGVASWFHRLCNAQPDFVANERIVWVDIEGVPLHAWSCATFVKICSKWGKVMELEECKDDLFARKRICIKTKLEDNILEKFKIIIRGKIFSSKGADATNGENNNNMHSNNKSDDDADTCFGEYDGNLEGENNVEQPLEDKKNSSDPFNIYGLLRKKGDNVVPSELDMSIPFPPGFTPEKINDVSNEKEMNEKEVVRSASRSEGLCSRIVKDAYTFDADLVSGARGSVHAQKKGGSILELLDDSIKVGQAMGYSMEGCEKDIEGIIGLQGVNDVIQ